MQETPAWHLLSGKQLGFSEAYHEKPRSEILSLLPDHAETVLDIGCGTGITSALLREKFPSARFLGAELQTEAREQAKRRLDRVCDHDLQHAPFADDFAATGTVDLVLLLDVLEHMYHPWQALLNLRRCLAAQATIIASIPNARCLAFLEPIAAGSVPYADCGLFDVTHVRFFTRQNAEALFRETGYDIEEVIPLSLPKSMLPTITRRTWEETETAHLVFKHGAIDGYNELFAGQWLIRAHPQASGPS
jgi:2-polyprenyl-3-methyl-5-hydroxy-6-metoxy-1,4-benzoquinol methylase